MHFEKYSPNRGHCSCCSSSNQERIRTWTRTTGRPKRASAPQSRCAVPHLQIIARSVRLRVLCGNRIALLSSSGNFGNLETPRRRDGEHRISFRETYTCSRVLRMLRPKLSAGGQSGNLGPLRKCWYTFDCLTNTFYRAAKVSTAETEKRSV